MQTLDVIFIIQAYDARTPDGQLIDNAVVEVYAKTEQEAIKKAKQYIKKKGYRIAQIIEKKQDVSA